MLSSEHTVSVPDRIGLTRFILDHAATYMDQTAMVDGENGRNYTYRQMVASVQNLAAALWNHGLRKGETVFCFLPNCIEYPIIFYGVISLGAIITTCNPSYTSGEIKHQIDKTRSKYVFTTPEGANKMKGIGSGYIKKIFIVGGSMGDASYEDLLLNGERCEAPPKANINPTEDIAVMPYSSGTTGLPKGVLLTHYNYIAQACALNHSSVQHLTPGIDVTLGILPFFHLYGQIMFFLLGIINGSKIVVFPKFDFEKTLQAIEKHKVTVFPLVPPMALMLAKRPEIDKYDLSSLRTLVSSAAPISATVVHQIQYRLTNVCSFRQGFGMTEVYITIMSGKNCKDGSTGKLVPNVQMRVIDIANGESLGAGKPGELRFKGPTVLKGYYKNINATKNAFDEEGWFCSGDIGYFDEDYNVYIVDRFKELIKYKGFQVSPAELEAVILNHQKVADVAVTSVLDDEAGELPIAFVVKKPGVDIKEKDIVDFVSERVAYYKKLRGGVVFVADIPKSPSGKILRRLLKDRARQSKL